MRSKSKRMKKKRRAMTFVAGAAIGALAGALLAKKPGDELKENIGENLEYLKDKAKNAYDNREEIIDNISRNIKKITQTEIKNFVNPKYYSKEYNEDGSLKEKIYDLKEELFEFDEDTEYDFEKNIKKVAKETKESVSNIVSDFKEEAKDTVNTVSEKIEDIKEDID